MKDPLDDALGLPSFSRPEPEITVPTTVSQDGDYEYARRNMYRLIAKGEDAMDELREIASISQHPRVFEVYANLYKSVIDANKDLLNIKKVYRDMESPSESGARVTNNNLIMTSEEVLKMLKDKS